MTRPPYHFSFLNEYNFLSKGNKSLVCSQFSLCNMGASIRVVTPSIDDYKTELPCHIQHNLHYFTCQGRNSTHTNERSVQRYNIRPSGAGCWLRESEVNKSERSSPEGPIITITLCLLLVTLALKTYRQPVTFPASLKPLQNLKSGGPRLT